MKIVVDASCLINLINGEVLDAVLTVPNHEYSIGPLVYEECKGLHRTALDREIVNGRLVLIDDSQVSAARFASLLRQYSLGDGETECLLLSFDFAYSMACDDRKARSVAQIHLDPSAVTGSLGLLRDAVRERILNPHEAIQAYKKMISAGAFLPQVDLSFFQS